MQTSELEETAPETAQKEPEAAPARVGGPVFATSPDLGSGPAGLQWKETSEGEDPFGLSPGGNREIFDAPEPDHSLSESEENAVHKELLHEWELASMEAHERLVFHRRITCSRDEAASYGDKEAEEIIRTQSRLNEEQVDAALAGEGDLNIQALAGTGKTSLLSATIAFLLAKGHDPHGIAISSHTVAAADEIRGRIGPTLIKLFPRTAEALGEASPASGTIHALAYRDLIAHKHPKGRWSILDEGAQFRVWKEASQFAHTEASILGVEDDKVGEDMRLVDRVRGYDIPNAHMGAVLRLITGDDRLAKTAETYEKVKEARKLIDYTDLLRLWGAVIIHPGYQGRWEHFFVDEFQDTNPLQKFLLKVLRARGAKLVVCGDNRQSINSFTGSDPTSHEEFFEKAGIPEKWLVTNYRCSKEVLRLANEILTAMMPPETKVLKAHAGAIEGAKVRLVLTGPTRRPRWTPPKEAEKEKKQEAAISCKEAVKLVGLLEQTEGKPSVALLYRTNSQGSLLEEAMASLNVERASNGLPPIAYTRKDYRRTALRNRTEREVLALLGCWADPRTAAWEGLLLTPYFLGIGEVTARTIQRKADRNKPMILEEVAEMFDGELSKRNFETVGDFLEAWERALGLDIDENAERFGTEVATEADPAIACDALQEWIIKTASRKRSKDSGGKADLEEAQRRGYEAALLDRIRQKITADPKKTLGEVVAETGEENDRAIASQNSANKALGLIGATGTGEQEKDEGIILSTIHLAKGREYDGVVVHQVAHGSMPHWNAIRFDRNDAALREKAFRKFCCFGKADKETGESWEVRLATGKARLPGLDRVGRQTELPATAEEVWEDHNNPLEEELRLLYVAVTRAKKHLVLTSHDHHYAYLPERTWRRLVAGG